MSTNDCENDAIFQQSVGPILDTLVEKIFKDVDKKINKNLSDLQILTPDKGVKKSDIDRQLKNALVGTFTDSLNPKMIANIKSKLVSELPCNSRQLKECLTSQTPRDVEEDIALLLAYGYQNGLAASEFRHMPAKTITFEFHATTDYQTFNLHAMKLNISPAFRGKYLSTVRVGESITKSGQAYQKVSSSKDELIKYIITLGVPLLFECLKWLWEKLVEALKSDDDETIEEAMDDLIDKAEDILDDVEDEVDDIKDDIKDLEDDIKELKEDLKDEDDADDRKELREEIEEKKDEKKKLDKKLDKKKEAKKKLEIGISRLKEARQKLR